MCYFIEQAPYHKIKFIHNFVWETDKFKFKIDRKNGYI